MKHSIPLRVVVPLLCLVLLAGFAAAQTSSLTGTLVTTGGSPVAGARVILDQGSFTATTDLAGQFLLTGLADTTYRLQVDPVVPTLAPRDLTVTVSGASTLGTFVLQPGTRVLVRLISPTGVPLLGANLNAYDLSGVKLFTPRDGTDVNGNGAITVPLGDVRFNVRPPVGSSLVPIDRIITSAASTTIDLGTLTMLQGYAVTGSLVRSGTTPLPVANAEIRTVNSLTGETVFQVNRRTTALGSFSLLLPFGLYEFRIEPAVGSPYAPRLLHGVFVIDYPRSLGLVTCDAGVPLSGSVVGPAGAVAGADIDVLDALGHKLYTPNDNTSPTGTFDIMVPAGGTCRVEVDPPSVLGLVGTTSSSVVVTTATNLGVIPLQAGFPATVTVVDAFGAAVPGAIAKVFDAASGQEFVLPENAADAQGIIRTVFPAATVNLSVQAPQGTTSAPFFAGPLPITAPIQATLPLASKTIWTDLDGLQILSIPNGGNLQLAWTIGNTTAQVLPFTLEAVVPLESGVEVPWIPAIPLDFPGPFALTLFVDVPMPPLAAAELNHVQRFLIRLRNPATQEILDEAYVRYVPQ